MASMEQDTAEWMEEEETYVVLNEPGSVVLQDPLKFDEPSLHVKQELEIDMDDCERKVQVYPSSMNIKEEMDDGMNQEFIEAPLCMEDPGLYIKQDPELNLDVDGSDHNVVASKSYASNSTRLLQSSGMSNFTFEEIVRQGMNHSEFEIGSEELTHIANFREGEEEEKEEEESLSTPTRKCILSENKCQMFSCSFCLRSFSSKYRLMFHVFLHIDGVQPPKFVCKSCCEVFPSYVSLQKHLKFCEAHQDSSAEKEETFDCSGGHDSVIQDDRENSGMDQTGRQCSSNETVKSFTDKCYTHNTTNIAEIRCRNDNNGNFDTSDKIDIHTVRNFEKRSHKCDVCEKSFTKLSQLKTHGLKHTGIKPHKCDVCGKSFTELGVLKRHSLIHSGIKPHKCDICGKSFTQSNSLKIHALIHTRMRPHKCDICGKTFTQSMVLKRHALIHTGSKPHKCDVCGKSFTELGVLKRHSLIHSGMRPHKCDICGKSFSLLGNLKCHALIHSEIKPHKCDLCGKSFNLLGNLKKHSLKHTGMQPHKCESCGKYFTCLSHLKSHALIHTGMKPHKCEICAKSFTQMRSLRRHSLIHT